MTRILFICMGNICRSPTVEAVARVEFARAGIAVEVASAGTEDYHVGQPADPRAIACAEAQGYALAAHRARQLEPADFQRFDLLLAMDRTNLRDMQRFRTSGGPAPVLFLGDAEVPDPYYGSDADFQHVVELARSGIIAMIGRLSRAPRGS
jgi:protein-tyrosine phosphatase